MIAVSDVTTRKRDLADVIVNITPTKTPVLTMLGDRTAINTLVETQRDELAAAAENAHNDGTTWQETTEVPPGVDQGYVQNFLTWVLVPDTLQDVQIHGMKKAYSYFSQKKLKEHARDIERALILQNPQGPAEPRKLKGMVYAITSNVLDGAGTAELTEDRFNNLLQAADDEGGEPSVVLTNSKQKRVISQFTGGSVKNLDAKAKKIIIAVDIVETDFGTVKIVRERFLGHDKLIAMDPSLWKLAWLRRTEHVPLPKDGDRTRGMIRSRLGLSCGQEKGNAYYKGLVEPAFGA